jgi:uncharacterized protein (DUF1499 family)
MFLILLVQMAVDTPGIPLPPCPDTPNCVSTLESGAYEKMEPWPWRGDLASTLEALRNVIESHPRTTLVREDGPHLAVEAKTWIPLFTDDVEFYVDEEAGLVHFRSASRVGQGDLGVNRRRMKRLGKIYAGL